MKAGIAIDFELEKERRKRKLLQWLLVALVTLGYSIAVFAQTSGTDIQLNATSIFSGGIKDAVKLSDIPEIKDSVKRITGLGYPITSRPVFPKYEVQQIQPAKIQNEPLPKLYHSLLKAGYSPLYNIPYAEFWITNARSRETSYGAHLRHLSSTTHLSDVGYGGFSENEVKIFGKQFYKKHTLSGEFNYERNAIHYYGYDTTLSHLDEKYTRQRYQLFEPKLRLVSHYTDSTHINHDIGLSFYNLQNLNAEAENNIKLDARGALFLNKEKFNVNFLTDFYNHKQRNDTLNNLIMSIGPSFEAGNKKWHMDLGVTATIDNFKEKTSFYFYPKLSVHYDIYDNIIVPYASITGGLQKNSMRSLTRENPFSDTTLRYTNTDNKYNVTGGLRGKLSSKTSYDVRATYSRMDSLYFYVIDYQGPTLLYNQFKILYDDATLFSVGGQLQYQLKEKVNVIAKGNYYLYSTKTLERPFHKPEFDITFSAIYNIASKIIVRADLFIMGKQWALTKVSDGVTTSLKPALINGWGDVNLEAEYRYSKMLSFFARANNIAGQRYYRWERYPSQKFSFMIGLTFVPF